MVNTGVCVCTDWGKGKERAIYSRPPLSRTNRNPPQISSLTGVGVDTHCTMHFRSQNFSPDSGGTGLPGTNQEGFDCTVRGFFCGWQFYVTFFFAVCNGMFKLACGPVSGTNHAYWYECPVCVAVFPSSPFPCWLFLQCAFCSFVVVGRKFFMQVSYALEHMHSRRIMHRGRFG